MTPYRKTVPGLPQQRSLIGRTAQVFVTICLLVLLGPLAHAASSPFEVRDQASGNTAQRAVALDVTGVDVDEPNAILDPLNITPKVIGGNEALRGQWPSVVGLVRPGSLPLRTRFFCGGTVIAETWIMTAAHCLFNAVGGQQSASSMRVIAGIHDLESDPPVEEIVVTNIIIHPDYDNDRELPPNDIALLELATPIDATLTSLFVEDSEDYTGTTGFIVGWGATQYVNESVASYPDALQQAEVPLVALSVCTSPQSYQGLISIRQLCAGFAEGGVDTCAGDSGGPLYIIQDDVPVQIGITSFGSGCGERDRYGIYTNVSHYIGWLSNYVSVPEQSMALVAQWEAGPLYPSQTYTFTSRFEDDSGLFGGAISPLALLILVLLGVFDHRLRLTVRG